MVRKYQINQTQPIYFPLPISNYDEATHTRSSFFRLTTAHEWNTIHRDELIKSHDRS